VLVSVDVVTGPLWPIGALSRIQFGDRLPRALVFCRPFVDGKGTVPQTLRKTSICCDRLQQFNDVIVDG
jgi:hypothetical protein